MAPSKGKKKEAPSSAKDDSPPPSKKSKSSESSGDFQAFLTAINEQREQVAESVAEYKFDKTRCKNITERENFPVKHKGVMYWMSRDQRVQDNWALLFAQRIALREKVPLYVCFCLVPKFLQATLRQYGFMLRGLSQVRTELHTLNIPFHLLFGEATKVLPAFIKKHEIGGVITDFSPLRVPLKWVKELSQNLPEDVPLCQIDAHNIVPVWVASDKQEYAARTIRPKITNNLQKYLKEFPPVVRHPFGNPTVLKNIDNPFEDWTKLIKFLEIDKNVKEVDWAKPGSEEGLKMLHKFVNTGLKNFHDKRNDPNVPALSNLSPWFHFGQLSVARAVMEVRKSKHKESVAAFVEESVVRRELSDNFCYYNENYDSITGAASWAQETLRLHKKDKRTIKYTDEQLEHGKTKDDLWNAAQIQLLVEGKMHGFLRMYWAKKILEWTESPEKALELAIYLNDKYELDGRDPNGYVGCMWSICGIHDQGWREREIFGKIRYMNYQGCQRKFDVNAFVMKYNRVAKEYGLR